MIAKTSRATFITDIIAILGRKAKLPKQGGVVFCPVWYNFRMKPRLAVLLLTFFAFVRCTFAEQSVLRTTREIADCRIMFPTSAAPFRLTAQVTYVRKDENGCARAIGIEDSVGCQALNIASNCPEAPRLTPGDIAEISGFVRYFSPTRNYFRAEECRIIRHGPKPEPINASISDLLNGKFNYQLTRTIGILRDSVTSETHPGWIMLVVCSGKDRLFISVPMTREIKSLEALVGRRISAVGICLPGDYSPRKWFGPTFKVASPSDIVALEPAAIPNERIPDITSIACASPDEIRSLGMHQAIGTVVAAWGGHSAVIKTPTDYVGLELLQAPPPTCGQAIRAIGLPETDLYRINLTRATWTAIPSIQPADKSTPELVSPSAIISDGADGIQINNRYFGRTIRMRGRVLSIPDGGRTSLMHLENGNRVFTADVSNCPAVLDGLDVGCFVEITGACILESSNLHRPSKFPRMGNFLIVLRSPRDIQIIARPSWWTPARLATAICILLVLIVAILVWNATLRIAVFRKSRALLKEQTAKIEESLKIDERTRLAVELHDYLAQNLTVVSYQISSAQNAFREKLPDAERFIEKADRMLQSCRTDLRRCLWDLKSDALSELDFTKAVLKTTALVAGESAVIARFDIRRTRLSDSTAHAILSICRELVSNAVQHGKAKTIRIAGEQKDGMIRFSVRDDGCGFDPAHRQGPEQGHFGLSGIIERVKRLGGQFEIRSSPETGTRIVITVANR